MTKDHVTMFHRCGPIVLTVLLPLALGGCIGGSGGGGGDSDSATDPDETIEPSGDITGADGLLYFTTGSLSGDTKSLVAVARDSPTNQAIVESQIVNNYEASGETSAQGTPNLHMPNPRNLPLGVFTGDVGGDGLNGTITGARQPYVVYNRPDGRLYRVRTDGDDPDRQRISTESNAGVVCGAALTPDFQNANDSLLVYQIPAENDGNCSETNWNMVRVGDDATTSPTVIYDQPTPQDVNIIPLQNWDTGAAIGFLASVEGRLDRFTADGAQSTVASTVNNPRVLERAGPTGAILMNNGGTLVTYDPEGPDELAPVTGEASVANSTSAGQAVRINERIIIADTSEGRLLEYSGDTGESSVLHNPGDWDSQGAARIVAATDEQVAWAYTVEEGVFPDTNTLAEVWSYDFGASSATQLTVLDNAGSTIFPVVQLNRRFPIAQDEAPNGWIFISDFAEQEAVALHISGGDSELRITEAEWWGNTWSPEITTIGRSAKHVLLLDYTTSDDQMDSLTLRSRQAMDPQIATQQSFNTPDDLFRTDLLGGYDNRTLAGMISTESGRDMLFMDMTDGNSLVRITKTPDNIARPVPFF